MLHILWGPDPDRSAKRFVVAFAYPREFIKQECTTLECTRRADIWQRSIQGSKQHEMLGKGCIALGFLVSVQKDNSLATKCSHISQEFNIGPRPDYMVAAAE